MATQEEIDEYPDELILQFRKPIKFSGQDYHEVVLKEPTAGQLREITRKSGPDATIHAIAVTGGILPGVAEQIPTRELMKAEAFFSRFLEVPQRTGEPG